MDLRNLLTRDIRLTSAELQFTEPQLGHIRLRGDLPWRIAAVLGAWAAGIGVMSLLFSINRNPPGFGVAVGLGAVFGLAGAGQLLFFTRKHVAGSFTFYPDQIQRVRTYTVFLALRTQRTRWHYNGIENCRIALRSKSGHPCDVLTFEYGSEPQVVVLPRKIDPKQLVKLFSRHGVDVTATSRVPASARQPFPPATAVVTCAVGVVLLIAGLNAFPWAPRPGGNQRPEIAGLPDFDPPEPFAGPDLEQPQIPGRGGQRSDSSAQGGPSASSAEATPSTNASAAGTFPPGFPDGGPGPGGTPNHDPAFGMRPATPSPTAPPSGFNRPDMSRPGRRAPTTPVADAHRSVLVGGEGGFPFEHVSQDGTPVVGVKVRTGRWSGSEHLAKVEPLYQAAEPHRNWHVLLARPGYVVGAVEV
ncbi:MAG: hypothetical protein ACF8TS_10885, partial [Maioricimonas sp. JB049]